MSNSSQPTTYSFLRTFEQSRVPCSQDLQVAEDVKNGIAKINIDGKPIYGGMTFNGQCHFGNLNREGVGYYNPNGTKDTFGGHTVFFSPNVKGVGPTTATTANAIRNVNQNWFA